MTSDQVVIGIAACVAGIVGKSVQVRWRHNHNPSPLGERISAVEANVAGLKEQVAQLRQTMEAGLTEVRRLLEARPR